MVINLIYAALFLFVSCNSPQVQITESNAEITSAKNNSENNFTAKVIRIIDGDTIEVLYHELPVTIRLEHIDCPEKSSLSERKQNKPFLNYVLVKISK